MGRLALGNLIMGFRFDGMNEVWKFGGVLNKKYRHVITHQVPVAFISIELHSEAPNIPDGIVRSTPTLNCGKTRENGGLFSWILEQPGFGIFRRILIGLKEAMSGGAPCVHNAFGDTLVVKVVHFFPENEVFQQRRTTLAGFQ